MALATEGRSDSEIAGDLRLGPLAVRTHIRRAMTELGARDRAQLVLIAYRTGLTRPGDARRREPSERAALSPFRPTACRRPPP
jgi:hypothetical protein